MQYELTKLVEKYKCHIRLCKKSLKTNILVGFLKPDLCIDYMRKKSEMSKHLNQMPISR